MTPKRRVGMRRLLKLATFLEKLPRRRFDYGSWAGTDWKGSSDLSCGTTACALGWATTIPAFRRLGLKLVWADDGPDEYPYPRPVCHQHYSEEAATKVFNLNSEEARFLFLPLEVNSVQNWKSPGNRASPKQVARHIRRFVKYIQREERKPVKGAKR